MVAFSILYRIELAVTNTPADESTPANVFQYPLSDRTRCNPASPWSTNRASSPFSILYRIELAVTETNPLEALAPRITFSILYRIELAVTPYIDYVMRPK